MRFKRSMGIAAVAAISVVAGSVSSGNAAQQVNTNGSSASFVVPGQTPALSICTSRGCAPTGSAIRNLTVAGETKSSSQSLTLDALQGAAKTQSGAACTTAVNYRLVFGFDRSSGGGSLSITWEEVSADGVVSAKRFDFDKNTAGDQDLVIAGSPSNPVSEYVDLCAN